MILDDKEIQERMESPVNLLNRLRTSLNRTTTLPGNHPHSPSHPPQLPPKSDDIIDDLQNKLEGATVRTRASSIMLAAMKELEIRIPEVSKATDLSRIANEMSRVISNVESKNQNSIGSQIIVYAPQVRQIDDYEVIDVNEG